MTTEELLANFNSPAFQRISHTIEFIFILVSLIFAGLIIYFAVKTPRYARNFRKKLDDFLYFNDFKKKDKDSKVERAWKNICALLKNDVEAEHKFAIIEADSLFSEILTKAGFKGENLGSQLSSISASDVPSLDKTLLMRLASLRENIVCDKNYRLDIKEAKKIIAGLEKELNKLED
jgi:hypothetical protein